VARFLVAVRVFGVVAVALSMATIAVRAVATWRLWHAEADRCTPPPNGTEFMSPWHFTFPLILFALLVVLGSTTFLREPKSRSWPRIILEVAYIALALYLSWFLWEAIYLVYNPFHPGQLG